MTHETTKDDRTSWKQLQGGHQLDPNLLHNMTMSNSNDSNRVAIIKPSKEAVKKSKKHSSPVIRISSYIQNTS